MTKLKLLSLFIVAICLIAFCTTATVAVKNKQGNKLVKPIRKRMPYRRTRTAPVADESYGGGEQMEDSPMELRPSSEVAVDDKKVKALEKELQSLKKEVGSLKATNREQQSEIAKLRTEKTTLDYKLFELQKSINGPIDKPVYSAPASHNGYHGSWANNRD